MYGHPAPLPEITPLKDSLKTESPGLSRRVVPETPKIKRTILGLKTNLLYDAATALNFAVEVPINKNFSFLYEHHCPWWLSGNNRYCLEFLSFGGELRWWFAPRTIPESEKRKQRDALAGHFLGLQA